jgi:hypothetical protein
MAERPKFSVLIPTRNRSEYVVYAVRTVLEQPGKDFELIVSDNHSGDDTLVKLRGIKDDRLKVVQPDSALAMSEHFEWLLRKAEGRWITVLGDDDGLQPYFFEFMRELDVAHAGRFDVIFGSRAYFNWPGVADLYGDARMHFAAEETMRRLQPRSSLWTLACGYETYFDYPQFYTGTAFRRELLDRLRSGSPSGRVIHSVNPDAASTASILLDGCGVLRVGVPLAWVGSSPKSNGAQASRGGNAPGADVSTFHDFQRLNSGSLLQVEARFRSIYTVKGSAHLIFLESLHETARAYGSPVRAWFDRVMTRHRLFAEFHRNARRKAGTREIGPEYAEVLAANRCDTQLLAVAASFRVFWKLRRSWGRRLERLGRARAGRLREGLRIELDSAQGPATTVDANRCIWHGAHRERIRGICNAIVGRLRQTA